MKLIDVSTKKYPNTFAMVDDEDYERINAHKWTARISPGNKVTYASRMVVVGDRRIAVHMHHEILGENHPKIVDHRDGVGLNNQKSNLRPATTAQNCFNRRPTKKQITAGEYRGVTRANTVCESWVARIGKRNRYLGTFRTQEQARAAYLEEAHRIYGEFVPAALISPLP